MPILPEPGLPHKRHDQIVPETGVAKFYVERTVLLYSMKSPIAPAADRALQLTKSHTHICPQYKYNTNTGADVSISLRITRRMTVPCQLFLYVSFSEFRFLFPFSLRLWVFSRFQAATDSLGHTENSNDADKERSQDIAGEGGASRWGGTS